MTARDACVKAKGKHFEHFCVLRLICTSQSWLLYWTVLYHSVNSLGVLDRLIHGLTRTVLKPSDSLVGWNVPTVRRAGKLSTDPTSSPASILMLLRPKTLGTLSAATIASCVGANAVRFGATQLRVTGNLQEDCGHRSTNYSVAAGHLRVLALAWTNSVNFSLTRSTQSGRTLPERRTQFSPVFGQGLLCRLSLQSTSTTSSLL